MSTGRALRGRGPAAQPPSAAGRAGFVALCLLLVAGAAVGQQPRYEPREGPSGPGVAAPPGGEGTLTLVLDDGTWEGSFGVSGQAAEQFMWFNQFTPNLAAPYLLEEIHVLFPQVPNLAAGDAVQLVVFVDPDADPTNGAIFLAALDDVVQAADGSTFSVYVLASPLLVEQDGDLLIGVVPRFIVSGVTPPTLPAALDSNSSAGRSWFAIWTGDPPDPPLLPPDDQLALIDTIQPGNWLIRGFGSSPPPPPPPPPAPTLPPWAYAMLAVMLAVTGLRLLRARQGA